MRHAPVQLALAHGYQLPILAHAQVRTIWLLLILVWHVELARPKPLGIMRLALAQLGLVPGIQLPIHVVVLARIIYQLLQPV